MKKVLVVDDDYGFSSFAKRLLEDNGLQVVTAASGQAGLDKAEAERPDLILLDLGLGDLDGFEVLRALKGKPELSDIPVVICSMTKEVKDMEKGLEMGAVEIMRKPLHPVESIPRIKAALSRGKEGAA